jgi:hypothetical protein
MTRVKLESQVKEAFQDAEYPGEDQLIGDSSDLIAHDGESNEIRDAFAQKRWNEITRDHLLYLPQTVSFFSPKAFVYYLPALLLATLDFDEETAYFRESFIRRLTRDEGNRQLFLQIVAALTAEQKRVVAEYLKFVTQEAYGGHPVGEAQIALERYWNQFFC